MPRPVSMWEMKTILSAGRIPDHEWPCTACWGVGGECTSCGGTGCGSRSEFSMWYLGQRAEELDQIKREAELEMSKGDSKNYYDLKFLSH